MNWTIWLSTQLVHAPLLPAEQQKYVRADLRAISGKTESICPMGIMSGGFWV